MTNLNAALSDTRGHYTLAAAYEPLESSDTSSIAGTYFNFDTSNRFTYREQLATANTYVSTCINKYARTLTKGIHYEGNSRAKKAVELVAKKINLAGQIQTVSRYFAIHGTYIAETIGKGETFQAKPLLPAATTILPEGIEPNARPGYILEPPIGKFYVNEGKNTKEIKEVSLDSNQVVYCAINPYDSIQEDCMQRKTRGLYGQSLLDPLVPTIKALLDVNEGQRIFYKKYGNGNRHYDFVALGEAMKNGIITPAQAQASLDAWMEDHKYISQNEDFIAYGIDVKRVDASGSLDVMKFKEALETEIMLGLYQSPLTMGKASGTTYASSYMVEEDRMLVLEGDQNVLQPVAQQILNKLLVSMNLREDSVTIEFDELSKIKLDPSLVIDMANSGLISRKQLLDYCDFEYTSDEEIIPLPTQAGKTQQSTDQGE